jgi:hypothetical protein
MSETILVGDLVAGESTHVRNQLERLIHNFDKSLFDIGELLYKVRRSGFYQSWGFSTFKEYVESLNFKERRAQYLTRIVSVMAELGINRPEYESLGIAKLREITSLDPNGTWTNPQTGEVTQLRDWIAGLVDRGEDMTLDELKQHIRTLKGLVGENDLVWENFCVKRSVRDNVVEPAKELARRNIGSTGKDEEGISKDASGGACLEVWCVEYLNNPANNVLEETNND